MSKSHIEKLIHELECAKWKIITDYNKKENKDFWMISRPNGDSLTKLNFMIGGNGKYGDHIGNEIIFDAINCSVANQPHINLYFGKFSKKFKKDLMIFIELLNKI